MAKTELYIMVSKLAGSDWTFIFYARLNLIKEYFMSFFQL